MHVERQVLFWLALAILFVLAVLLLRDVQIGRAHV